MLEKGASVRLGRAVPRRGVHLGSERRVRGHTRAPPRGRERNANADADADADADGGGVRRGEVGERRERSAWSRRGRGRQLYRRRRRQLYRRPGSAVVRRVLLTLVPIRPRWRGERRSLRTFSPGVSLRPSPLAFNPDTPRRLSNSASDAFQLHPDVASYRTLDPQPGSRPCSARCATSSSSGGSTAGARTARTRTRRSAPWTSSCRSSLSSSAAVEAVDRVAPQARSISHWSPYDRVGVVIADP